jgi:hypothetical protein
MAYSDMENTFPVLLAQTSDEVKKLALATFFKSVSTVVSSWPRKE